MIETYYTFSYPWVSLRLRKPRDLWCPLQLHGYESPFKSRVPSDYYIFILLALTSIISTAQYWISSALRFAFSTLRLISVHDQIVSDNLSLMANLSLLSSLFMLRSCRALLLEKLFVRLHPLGITNRVKSASVQHSVTVERRSNEPAGRLRRQQ